MKQYRIVNNFKDAHTGERYKTDHEPVEFSPERVKEIETVEKVIGYKLIEEIKEEVVEETTEKEKTTDETVEEKEEVVEETTEKVKKKNK